MFDISPYCDSRNSNASSITFSNLKLEDKLRLWRHDAYLKNLLETAAFWGNKVLTMTGDSNDAYWLAQIYYNMGQYLRAKKLLQKLMDSSVLCRFLAAKCCVKIENYQEVLDILGEENPFDSRDGNLNVKNAEEGIQLEASMCYLRGIAYSQQSNFAKAKNCFKEALEIDVKCYEFIKSLKFEEQLDVEEAHFIKLNYISMLKKYDNLQLIQESRNELEKNFKLSNNTDLLLTYADELYTQCKFEECYKITSKILEKDQHNPACLPIHIVCLHELRNKNKLFMLAHELVEHCSDMPVTWFGVGCYNYLIGQNDEARRYFIKASTMDSRYEPAWIGFGHSFAIEGEHDQAITAYNTAAKLFKGSHFPNLFIGMQHLLANNLKTAEEYLMQSYSICSNDPLLLNELAIYCFKAALISAEFTKCRQRVWETTWMNMGHVYRKLGELDVAESYFRKVTYLSPPNPSALTAIGYIYHVKEQYDDAINYYHEALGLRPCDPIIQDLLSSCLEEMVNSMNISKK
ncbi:2840_t:CDS:10 [Entrophospora sp. SA101]|nr:2840_t:CDS:10 [Entrophospora sp. SA101]